MSFVIIILISYILGSIPIGYLIAKFNGVKIQEVGSGNIGATNVWRACGWKWGMLTLISDIAKGYLAVCAIDWIFSQPPVGYYILAGSLAVIGHFKPVWLGFKGGKVVATSLGVLLGLLPFWYILVILGVFVIVLIISKQVSLASMCASAASVVTKIIFGGGFNQENYPMTAFVLGLMVVIVFAHKDNIKRIAEGKERKI